MIAGTQLIRRLEGVAAHVFSTPLIVNKTTGVKFGKSEDGAVWLDPAKTSPYKFYQFWLNTDDEMAKDLIKIYTQLDKETIKALIDVHDSNPGERALQKRLAAEVTELVHGRERRESVERVTGALFGGHAIAELNEADLDELSHEIPATRQGKTIVEILVEAGVVASNGEARRLIASGGVSNNGEKVVDDESVNQVSLIKKGKNTFVLVR
jgi:tyrosyl-tRNA synthetase